MKQTILKEGLDVVLNFLQKIEALTRREKHVTNQITLHYVKDAEELDQLRTELGSKPYSTDEEQKKALETLRTTATYLQAGDELIGLNDCSINSISGRLNCSSVPLTNLYNTNREDWCKVINLFLKNKSDIDRTLVTSVEGEVVAFASGNDNQKAYSVFPLVDVVNDATNALVSATNDDPDATNLEWSLEYSIVRWYLPCELSYKGREYRLQIEMKSSDAAQGAIVFNAYYEHSGLKLPLCSNVRIEHRKQYRKSDIDEAISEVVASIKEEETVIESLKDIKLQFPKQCLLHVLKAVGGLQRRSMAVVHQYQPVDGTAYEVYAEACKSLAMIDDEKKSFSTRMVEIGNLLKITGITDWCKYDYDSSIDWSWK